MGWAALPLVPESLDTFARCTEDRGPQRGRRGGLPPLQVKGRHPCRGVARRRDGETAQLQMRGDLVQGYSHGSGPYLPLYSLMTGRSDALKDDLGDSFHALGGSIPGAARTANGLIANAPRASALTAWLSTGHGASCSGAWRVPVQWLGTLSAGTLAKHRSRKRSTTQHPGVDRTAPDCSLMYTGSPWQNTPRFEQPVGLIGIVFARFRLERGSSLGGSAAVARC